MQPGILFFVMMQLLAAPNEQFHKPEQAAVRAYHANEWKKASFFLSMLKDRKRQKREHWSKWNAQRMRVAYLAARIALKQNKPKTAVSWLQPLLRKPSQIRDYITFTLAEAHMRSGKPEQAIKLYRFILKEFDHHWRRPVRHKLIIALTRANKWKELGDHMKKLLWYPRPYGGRKHVLWEMTKAYVKAGQGKKVKKWLRHFPLRYPTSQEAKEARQITAQLTSQKKPLKLAPWTPSEKMWKLFHFAARKPKQAIEKADKWIGRCEKNRGGKMMKAQLELIKARAYLRLRQYSDLLAICKPLLSKSYLPPIRRRAVYLMGRAYIETGTYKEGSRFLHAYAEKEPERRMARWASRWAARLAMMGQDYKRARRLFWEYLKIYPDAKYKKRLNIRWFRAWCLFRMGQYRKAIYAFRSLRNRTRFPGFRRRLAYWSSRANERWGKWRKARDGYVKLVKHSPLTYYGILAKQRLYVLEVKIRRESAPHTCRRKEPQTRIALPPIAKSPKSNKRRKRKRRSKRNKRNRRNTKPQLQLARIPIDNPLWKRSFSAPWKEGWAMMLELDTHGPISKARLDNTMRENVMQTIKRTTKPVPFPPIPQYCYTRNSRHCKRVRRAKIMAKLGFHKAAVAELFRGRWVMRHPQKRLVATIRWLRSRSAYHEAIRMSYWLRGKGFSAFKENEYMHLRYPPAHANMLFKRTKQYNVSLAFAWGIMREESLFFRNTYSRAAARGLMQIIPKTAYKIAKLLGISHFSLRQLYAPKTNIRMGCWYLGQLLQKFEFNVQLAAAAYNAGPHRVESWLQRRRNLAADEFTEEIPFDETREYVRRVLRSYTVYNFLYKRSLPRPITTVAVRVKDNINF